MEPNSAAVEGDRVGGARWAWCCGPPRPAAHTRGETLADRLLPVGRGQWAFFAVVVGAVALGPNLPRRVGLAVQGAAMLAASWWCVVNLWRCREAHCAVTGPGWAVLGVVALAGAAVGHSVLHGAEAAGFVIVLAAGFCFQWLWHRRRGTTALGRGR